MSPLHNNGARRGALSNICESRWAAPTSCDANDGPEDGLIEKPRLCNFDPSMQQSKR